MICTPAGVAGVPSAPAGVHSFVAVFRGFASLTLPAPGAGTPLQGARAYLEKYVSLFMKSYSERPELFRSRSRFAESVRRMRPDAWYRSWLDVVTTNHGPT